MLNNLSTNLMGAKLAAHFIQKMGETENIFFFFFNFCGGDGGKCRELFIRVLTLKLIIFFDHTLTNYN